MATKKKKSESVVRCFEVGQPTLHPKGHTIYRISQKMIHVDAPEKAVEEFHVWRRYNDFKKLYAAMFKLHKALQRRDEFPPFARSQVFGRYDETVIIERMRSAQDLLNFVGQRVYMVNSKAFQQFFEGAEQVEIQTKTADILQPTSMMPTLKSSAGKTDAHREDSSDTESLSSATDPHASAEDPQGEQEILEDLLGGVWKYRQVADEISLEGGSSDEQTDFTDDSALSTPLPDADLSFFDPLTMPEGLPQTTGSDMTNEWLLSAMNVCSSEVNVDSVNNEPMHKLGKALLSSTSGDVTEGVSSIDATSPVLNAIDGAEGSFGELSSFDVKPKSGSVVECGKGDLTMSPMHNERIGQSAVPGPSHESPGVTSAGQRVPRASMQSPAHSSQGSVTLSPKRSPKRVLSASDMQEKADYIVIAANQISLAQQCEANNNYNMAFSYYKSGVGILLTGVQKDENAQRREVVRRKTARYLIKAEELYHKYLADVEEQERNRWDTGQPSPAKELLTPNIAFLQGAISEMRKFKVLGIVDKVMLVMDPDTEGTYVIKVLQKRCSAPPISQKSIIPNYIPYMVRLYKFFETDSAIFLLLQYASGGKLWTYVDAYLNQHQQDLDLEILDDPHEHELRSRSSSKSKQSSSCNTDTTLTSDSKYYDRRLPSNSGVTDEDSCSPDRPMSGGAYVELFLEDTVGYSKTSERLTGIDQIKHNLTPGESYSYPTLEQNKKGELHHDTVSFSMDLSHDSSLQKAIVDSNKRKSSAALSCVSRQNSDTSAYNLSADQDGFRELLHDTKPSLENFSINSFDSDSGPGSRYESTTSDHIESIPEVSEISPANSPLKSKRPPPDTNVFRDNHCDVTDGSRGGTAAPVETPCSHSTPRPKSLFHGATNSAKRVDDDKETDEPSIYDQFKRTEDEESVSSCSPDDSGSKKSSRRQLNETFDSHVDKKSQRSIEAINTELSPSLSAAKSEKAATDARGASSPRPEKRSPTPCSSDSPKVEVFRQLSQERSAESPVKPQKRTLSSVFAELDLAEDERRKRLVRLPEGCVRQWGAELIVSVTNLHTMGIVVGDLHPDNVLLGERGHVLLTYQCQWNIVDQQRREDSLLQGYAAPEIYGISEPSQACDWWSLGTMMYELLTGKRFGLEHSGGVNTHTHILIPEDLSTEAQSLLQELLRYDPRERLGSGLDGSADIRLHPFFNGIQWNELQGQMLS